MDCFLKCVILISLLSVHVSYTSAELTEFLWSNDEISGVYKNDDGSLGIRFFCRPGELKVQTLNNVTLVNFSSFHEVEKRMVRSVYMLNGQYLQHKHSAHRHLDRSVGTNTKPFTETVSDLLYMEEITVLKDASHAVGDQGATGKNTPITLSFHMFALKMTQLLEFASPNPTRNSSPIITPQERHQRNDCDQRFRRYHDCKGLCGPRCRCWEWVCGDCCYHKACFDHDICCEIYGYTSSQCIVHPSTISSQCDEPFDC